MYDTSLTAKSDARLTLTSGGQTRTVDLYSPEGQAMVAGLWIKQACQFRLLYEPSWLGIPVIQFSDTLVMMQELIWKLRPDVIVECGVAHGGSAVFYASLCELIGKGRILGVDVEIRRHNRVAIAAHPLSHRIELIEGSSVDPSTFRIVREKIGNAGRVLVVLDSNHAADHVAKELALYHTLVTPGSYLVAMDGVQAHCWDVPAGKEEWTRDNPLTAIHDFLKTHADFAVDPHYTRTHITSCPDGFLRRRTEEERERS